MGLDAADYLVITVTLIGGWGITSTIDQCLGVNTRKVRSGRWFIHNVAYVIWGGLLAAAFLGQL